jgi:hypothetical protein
MTPEYQCQEDGDRRQLEARFNHLLTLANRLPAGASEDCVRRCVCEVMEADRAGRNTKVQSLLTSIARLQHERQRGLRRAQQTGATAIERLLTALCDAAAPLLPPFAAPPPHPQEDQMTDAIPAGENHAAPTPFDQDSWDRWKERGIADDFAFNRKLRKVAVAIAAIAIASAMVWWL